MGGRGVSYLWNKGQGRLGHKNLNVGAGSIPSDVTKAMDLEQETKKPLFRTDGTMKLNKDNIKVYESTDKIDEKFLKAQYENIQNIQNNLLNKHKLGISKAMDDTFLNFYSHNLKANSVGAATRYRPNDDQSKFSIIFNHYIFSNPQAVYNYAKDGSIKGHFALCDKQNYDKYIATHEYGHYLHFLIIEKRLNKANKKVDDYSIKYEGETIRNEILTINKSKYRSDDNIISEYGKENSFEFFAEAFAESQLSTRKSTISRSMLDYLSKEGELV